MTKITDMKVKEYIDVENAHINLEAAKKVLKLIDYEKKLKDAAVKAALRHAGYEE